MTSSPGTPIIGHSFHRLLIRYLRWARSAAPLRLNAHLKVAPAQCVYGFYFLSDFPAMPYYRRPYKRPRYGKAIKYSVQQKCITVTTPDESATGRVEVVPGTDVEGMRKVKHLTVSMSPDTADTFSFYWALVPIARNLNDGDAIYLLVRSAQSAGPTEYNCVVRYAISLH